ncbi:zinc finger, SWIM-type containing protein [Tanacetum coccineum]
MDIFVSLHDIPVQNPSVEDFSAADLKWVKFGTSEHPDDVALIPYTRVDDFIFGESSNVESPTRFHIERGRKRKKGSLKKFNSDEYLESRLYWCSFGPEDYGDGGIILQSRRYRLKTRNRAARPQSMRGCTCHFVVKRLYDRPALALIIYNDNDRRHVNKSGFICHGPLDRDAIGPRAKKVPYVGHEIQQQTMSMIYLGIPEENVLEKHIEGIQHYYGSDVKVNSQYVHKLGMVIKRSTHELDLDDQASIRIWADRNKKSTFYYQDTSETEPFILGIQTDWQLQQMLRFGHRSLIAVDSTFGIKRLKYPLCTLLVFDSRQHALPVAWIVTRSVAKSDISKWMKALLDRVRAVDPTWKVNGFLIDDAAAETDPIRHTGNLMYFLLCANLSRETFSCPILLSVWRIRRSWLRHIVKKCRNIEVQREIFKRLGEIVYSIWGGVDPCVVLEKFTQDFVDQTEFMQYFKDAWLPKFEMWLTTMKTIPLASQEASGAIEAYHVKLKMKLFDDSHLGALQRVDWLVHKLTTELHSSYWLDRYADESDTFENVKYDYINSTSWHRALQIPDTDVTLDNNNNLFAKIVSQHDRQRVHLVWNPGSEFSFCDCEWSLRGNLCKHVVKVNIICENLKEYESSMSFQSYQEILMSMFKKPLDDSLELDMSVAWMNQIDDQIQKLVELNRSNDISTVVSSLPLKWCEKRNRTSIGRPATVKPSSSSKNINAHKKNRKRRRLSRLT